MISSRNAILITGATSTIGRQVVEALHEAGEPVRALCRRPAQVAAFQEQGVDAILGDLGEPDSLRAAMAGCDRLFLLTLAASTQRQHGQNAVEAAVAAGVQTVVHLSSADANLKSAIPWASAPAATDAMLRKSGLAWTLLKPSAFMQNILESAAPIRRGVLPQTSGAGAIGWIDASDIAAVAVRVLVESSNAARTHAGREYVLTGPERLSMSDIAARLSSVLGHRVRYVHLPAPLFYLVLRLTSISRWTARGLVHQFVDVVRKGQDDGWVITDAVRQLTGTSARTFTQFVVAHRQQFVTR